MRLLWVVIVAIALPVFAMGQARVTKVRGNKAIVDLPKGTTISEGDLLYLEGGAGASGKKGAYKRQHSLGMAFDYNNNETKYTASTAKTTNIDMNFKYRYIMGTFELGGGLDYESAKTDTTETSTQTFFGLGRFNFTPNKPGNNMIPYVEGQAGIANMKAGGGSANGIIFGFSGGINYFPFGEILSIEGGPYYTMGEVSDGDQKIKINQIGLSAGLNYVF